MYPRLYSGIVYLEGTSLCSFRKTALPRLLKIIINIDINMIVTKRVHPLLDKYSSIIS